MKKNISINISGIIFHIEEDGYEALKRYLDSINKYFSSFEDSSEILADIESRIAELFLGKLNEGKQVITSDDVKNLIATMGNVSDFQAAEENAEPAQAEAPREEAHSSFSSSAGSSATASGQRKFYRDQKRKVLGGVCAGLGNHLNVDPVWIRLIFAFLTLAYGITLLAYLILWIVVPGSYELDEPEVTKKLFRDPEKRVLGGVSGGLAAYFGMDVVAVRILFVVFSLVGGLGFITYIVLWIVLPEARSITDKMQMQGEPVTLSNIESSIKKNVGTKEGEENAFVKILLFPFRLLGWLIQGLAKILTPLAEVLRVAVGIFITFLGLTLVFGVVVAGGIMLGIFSFQSGWLMGWDVFNFPVEAFSRTIPGYTVTMGFIAFLIPGVIILLLGISVIAKRIVFNAVVGWSLFILFFISVGALSISVPKIAFGFKEDGRHKVETEYLLAGKTAVLKMKEVGMDDYDVTRLTLKGYEGEKIKLVQVYEAQGRTRQEAGENAKMVYYEVLQEDSVLTFDSNIRFKEDALFKGQRLNMTLYIPYGQSFVLDENVWRLLTHYVDYDYRDGETWQFSPKGKLECQSCDEQVTDEWEESDEENDDSPSGTVAPIIAGEFEDFNELDLSGLLEVTATRGNRYSVELAGPDEEKERYKIYTSGNTLVVEYDDNRDFSFRKNPLTLGKAKIRIVMPELENVEVKGAGEVTLTGFTEDNLTIEAVGAVKVTGEVNARELTVHLTGASELELAGEGNNLEAEVLGASYLKAYDYKVTNAIVKASGASRAKVNVTGRLEIEEGVASNVDYMGSPREVFKE